MRGSFSLKSNSVLSNGENGGVASHSTSIHQSTSSTKSTSLRTGQLALLPIQNPGANNSTKSTNNSGGPTPRSQSTTTGALGYAGATVIGSSPNGKNIASSNPNPAINTNTNTKLTQRPQQSQQLSSSTMNTTGATTSRETSSIRAPSTIEDSPRSTHTNSQQVSGRQSDTPTGSGSATPTASGGNGKGFTFQAIKAVGQGAFGTVYLAKIVGNNKRADEVVAIKKVKLDPSYENRELVLLKAIAADPHPNVIRILHHFSSKGSGKGSASRSSISTKPSDDALYLNVVMDYVPETLHSINMQFVKRRQLIPDFFVKLYTYQMLRALAHIHGMGIVHRDIKPQNLLIDPVKHVLKLCDFGAAKRLVKGETNVAYICSRYYRAPELILGGNAYIDYGPSVDVWSAGCVFVELLRGYPIFPGKSASDQLIEIIKVLGTPSKEQWIAMSPPGANSVKLREIPATEWSTIIQGWQQETDDVLKALFEYNPATRVTAIDACILPYFNAARDKASILPSGQSIAEELFSFTQTELTLASEKAKTLLSSSNTPTSLTKDTVEAVETAATTEAISV